MSKHTCQPAADIIKVLGGCHAISRVVHVEPSSVMRWASEEGSRGRIPSRHWRKLIAMAEAKGILLTFSDLLGA